MSRYHIAAEATADLESIWQFIAADNMGAADRQAAKIVQTYRTLAQNPQMGRVRSELSPGLRSFPVGHCVIFYRSIDDGIPVVRVLHGARDIGVLLDED